MSNAPLVLIVRFEQPEGIEQAIKNGHHVFVPLRRTGATGAFSLPRLIRHSAEQALVAMGISSERARDLATLARRSVPALRRKLTIAPGVQIPTWAQPDEAPALLAPHLLGAWHDPTEVDRKDLSHLAEIPYEDHQHLVVRWSNETDPPIRLLGVVWILALHETCC